MKRPLFVLALAAATALASTASADNAEKSKGKAETKGAATTMTLTGEIVDMGCYMGHEARGEKHKECALKCIANGMPMGLLTSNNKLYLLTLNHDSADPYNQCKEWAGSMVEVTGAVSERGGMRSIDVASAKPATMMQK